MPKLVWISERFRNWSSTIGLLIVVALAFAAAIFTAQYRKISSPDAFDYLQIAINVARGEGFVSSRAFLNHLQWFYAHGFAVQSGNVPMLYRFPLPVVVEALLIQFGLTPYVASQAYSILGYLLSGALMYLISNKLLRSGWIAAILSLGFLLSEIGVGASISGLTEPMATFFFLASIYVLLSLSQQPQRSIFVGVITGLAYLNRYTSFLYMLPVLLIGLVLPTNKDRSRRTYLSGVLIALLTLLFTVFPWILRNIELAGDPFFSFTIRTNLFYDIDSGCAPGNEYSFIGLLASCYPAVLNKIFSNIYLGTVQLREFLAINKLVLLPFLVGNWVVWRKAFKYVKTHSAHNSPESMFDWKLIVSSAVVWYVALVSNLVGFSFSDQNARWYSAFLPLVPLFSFLGLCEFLLWLTGKICLGEIKSYAHRLALLSAFFIALSYFALNIPILHEVDTPQSVPWSTVQAIHSVRNQVCSYSPGVVLSDVSSVTAVEFSGCRQLSVQITGDKEIKEINTLIPVQVIIVSPKARLKIPAFEKLDDRISSTSEPPVVLSDGSMLYKILGR